MHQSDFQNHPRIQSIMRVGEDKKSANQYTEKILKTYSKLWNRYELQNWRGDFFKSIQREGYGGGRRSCGEDRGAKENQGNGDIITFLGRTKHN